MLALNTTQQQQQQLNHCVTWENELNYAIHNINNENCGCWNRKIYPQEGEWEGEDGEGEEGEGEEWEGEDGEDGEGEWEENCLNSNWKALRCIERHE